jgi:hypothetical protein
VQWYSEFGFMWCQQLRGSASGTYAVFNAGDVGYSGDGVSDFLTLMLHMAMQRQTDFEVNMELQW